MKSNEQFCFEFSKSQKEFPSMVTGPANSIAVFTVLCILRSMRKELSLEAMLEYMEKYLVTVEKYNPQLKNAVRKVISTINIEKIYKDAMS